MFTSAFWKSHAHKNLMKKMIKIIFHVKINEILMDFWRIKYIISLMITENAFVEYLSKCTLKMQVDYINGVFLNP